MAGESTEKGMGAGRLRGDCSDRGGSLGERGGVEDEKGRGVVEDEEGERGVVRRGEG